uniref:Beta-microseminoprotein n=1 Tax=Branchiostoma belcheri tsingtauense TaxID=155462 RepID=Q6Q9W5_BRABE|nr:beta-microseminoprotein [Branchiostoma belcheri tsingtauense]
MCATWRMSEGSTYFAYLQSEDRQYGPEGNVRVVTTPYCEWEGKKMMIGSSWKTTGCEECSCTDSGLSCSGSGIYMVPDHCLLVVDENCQTDVVDADDPFSPCGMPQFHRGK